MIQALRPAAAPRVIILLSSGLATGADPSNLQQFDPITRAAAEVGVQFYALTEVTDGVDLSDRSLLRAAARREEGSFLTAGVQTMASAAGGEAFKVIGQADRFFTRIIDETSGTYHLGVEPPTTSKNAERFLNAKVSVRGRSDVTVRSRRSAVLCTVEAAPASPDEAIRGAIARGGAAYGVPIALATAVRRAATGTDLQFAINAEVPAATGTPILAAFAVLNEAGQVVKSGRTGMPQPAPGDNFRLSIAVPLPAGRYRLRFAAADASGSVGSLDAVVAAQLGKVGPFLASDLITAWVDANGKAQFLALEEVPAAASVLSAQLELYAEAGGTLPDGVTVRFALVPAGQSIPTVESDALADLSGGALRAEGQFPLDAVAAGAYTLRATVSFGGKDIGTVATTIKKK
jgi:hypothetical protein